MAVKTGVTSASLGPIFSLTSPVIALKCSMSYEPGRRKMQPRAATPGMSGKRCLSGGGAGRRKCAGQPPPWHGGALVLLACDLAFLPLLRASYFAPAQPLCLPGARPSSRSRDTRDAGVMGSRRVNSDHTRSGSPKASALNKPFRGQKSTPHRLGTICAPKPEQWGEEV